MMHAKIFEVRDRGTFIPMVGVVVQPHVLDHNESEYYLLRRAGFSPDFTLVLLTRADGGEAHYDCHDWSGRTYPVAHKFIAEHWDELKSGAVIDVEFILGETQQPKASERVAS